MTVLITGGSGFLGRGLLREWPNAVVYSRDEYKQDLCRRQYKGATYVLGDITDFGNLCRTIKAYDVTTIIHTAAIKYIPEAEQNVIETLRINLLGSQTVFDAAVACNVERVCAISTDKAVSPLNVYGGTKLLMERMLCEYARLTDTIFTGTRYGNVVGSTGSVVPVFKSQLDTQGYVTITNPEMTRYWLSIKEAVDLVKLALICDSGNIVIPNPGAMRLDTLAASLAGRNVKVIGMRPGEKIHESLLNEQEAVRACAVDGHIELRPRVQLVGSLDVAMSSDRPAYWITPDRFLEMIKESELV